MKDQIVVVDGKQVFTADFVFQQIGAQSCRIDRARHIALVALLLASVAVVAVVYLAIR